MKKLLYVILAVVITAALAGCNYANKLPAVTPYSTYGANMPDYGTNYATGVQGLV